MTTGRERRIAQFWARRRPAIRERVWRLQLLAERLTAVRAPDALLEEGRHISGQLAGSLGVFGFMEGSAIAGEIETLLEREPVPARELAARVAELASRLEAFTPPPGPAGSEPE